MTYAIPDFPMQKHNMRSNWWILFLVFAMLLLSCCCCLACSYRVYQSKKAPHDDIQPHITYTQWVHEVEDGRSDQVILDVPHEKDDTITSYADEAPDACPPIMEKEDKHRTGSFRRSLYSQGACSQQYALRKKGQQAVAA